MLFGIDSSNCLMHSGVVSGGDSEVSMFYKKLSRFMTKIKVSKPFHWTDISSNKKGKISKEFIDLIKKSKVNFNIFTHKKPKFITKSDYFHTFVPKEIIKRFVPFLRYPKRFSTVSFDVDDDYGIKNTKGTIKFVRKVFNELSINLINKHATINGGTYLKMVLNYDARNISFYGQVSSIHNSDIIQLADILLGVYRYNNLSQINRVYTHTL